MKSDPRKAKTTRSEILPEYDFAGAKPNKFAARYKNDSSVVVLEPDVAAAFPSAREVNDALRALSVIIQNNRKRQTKTPVRRSA